MSIQRSNEIHLLVRTNSLKRCLKSSDYYLPKFLKDSPYGFTSKQSEEGKRIFSPKSNRSSQARNSGAKTPSFDLLGRSLNPLSFRFDADIELSMLKEKNFLESSFADSLFDIKDSPKVLSFENLGKQESQRTSEFTFLQDSLGHQEVESKKSKSSLTKGH